MEGSHLIPAAVLPLENTDHCQDDCKDQDQEAGYPCGYSNHPGLILTHKERQSGQTHAVGSFNSVLSS